MKFFRRGRKPSRRAVEDVDLDSLLALVADSLGFTCAFAADGTSLTLRLPAPRRPRDGEILVRLTGLRREAGRRPREDWPTLVSQHLARAVGAAGGARGIADPGARGMADAAGGAGDIADPAGGVDACDYDRAGPLLGTRVEAVDDVPDLTRVVGRHLNGDLVELLTVGARPVLPEEAGCWPVPPGEALDRAVGNVRRGERLSVEAIELSGTAVTRLTGRTPSAATHLRWLGAYLPVPAHGVLAVLPDPYTLLVHPVNGIGVVRAIERLRVHAARTGGLSPQVYWWHQGRLTLIRADIELRDGQTRLVVAPPPDFARVLARLAA
ncbi:hypothetical protein HTZ77_12100 [Nonomuraea sp. SMC257]|uniref:Uncharacterized protein n=1 Tax=Nonomuraea montanisoli TaxID=2741721 RepID=A0A7Y6I850_9ACTN|nr:hypothetical protein [Nonomuraea montanisoli]NUW32169.1 hypothetical protein [Nonomuraea montanisoli]